MRHNIRYGLTEISALFGRSLREPGFEVRAETHFHASRLRESKLGGQIQSTLPYQPRSQLNKELAVELPATRHPYIAPKLPLRNEPCSCSSGVTYKKCCLGKPPTAIAAA